jgi:uncharacterized protein
MLARLGLVPHQERFYDLFNRSVANTLDGARVLADVLERFVDVPSAVARLKDIERRGDSITREVFVALNRSYMTPFDRDDIGPLAAALDDLMDHVESVGRRIPLYRITATTPLAGRLGRVILEQVELLNTAVPLLEDPRRTGELENLLERVHKLENEADDLLADAVSTLYDGVEEVPQLIQAVRWGELFQLLEDTTDKAERAAVVIRTIADKNA